MVVPLLLWARKAPAGFPVLPLAHTSHLCRSRSEVAMFILMWPECTAGPSGLSSASSVRAFWL